MTSNDALTQIIERLVAQCQRSTCGPLGFLEGDENVYECPTAPAEVVSTLREEYSVEDLLSSGILVVGECEDVDLAPSLTGEGSFLVLRDAVAGRPYGLLTRAGCLSADSLPVFEILRDQLTRSLLEQTTGELFVVCDLKDVILLRACGLPATLAVGLDRLSLADLVPFCDSFGLTCFQGEQRTVPQEVRDAMKNQSLADLGNLMRRTSQDTRHASAEGGKPTEMGANPPAETDSAESPTAQLVIVGWTPSELSGEVPRQLPVVVDHLRQLQRFMELDLDGIGLWEASEERLERLRFIAADGHSAIFQEALLDEAEQNDVGINQFGAETALIAEPPDEYTAALKQLRDSDSSESEFGVNQKQDALCEVHRQHEAHFVAPLRALARTTHDPRQRALLLAYAELSHLSHLQATSLIEQLSRRVGDHAGERGDPLPENSFQNYMATLDRLIGLAKVAKTWNPSPAINPSRTIQIDSTGLPRLPHSG